VRDQIQFYIHKIVFMTIFLFGLYSQAQTISVDDSGFTPQQMVDLLLSNSCATNSNISISSGQSVAYFNGNASVFPIGEGIIIRSGLARNSAGLYTDTNLSSQGTTNGDPDLQAISNQSGQSSTITDAAFLQFDFVPSSTGLSFDFLFASNEYGEWQCGFSDVFAFLLTDLNTGTTTNIAVVPGTSTPISVRDIRDNQYNSSCTSVNPDLFSTYNVNDPSNSALNMRGHTVVLNASAEVIPNNPYRIKLVIGDYNDADFDSAVFIEAGSFDTTLDIGEDQTLCDGDDLVIDSVYSNTTDFSYEWQLDGVTIPGETNPTLTVTQAGTYDLIITTLSTGCTLTDQLVVSDLTVNDPIDLIECDLGSDVTFNLTVNDQNVLGIDATEYNVFYYSSLDNANNNIPMATADLTAYSGSDGDIIYMRIQNIATGNFCSVLVDFTLSISEIEATIPNDLEICQEENVVDIPLQVEVQILNGLNPNDFLISYFLSESDAQDNVNAIADPSQFPLSSSLDPITIWARLIDNDNPICFDIINFTINRIESPLVDNLPDIFRCTDYTLPTLTNGNYFTLPNGQGIPLFAGDVIQAQSIIYIYNENSEGCVSEDSFTVNMADEFNMETQYCDQFTVPSYPNADFYTAPSGPNGTGSIVPAGTVFTNDVTIYFYAVDATDNSFCTEFQFDIEVIPLPVVEERTDVITCDSYTLPPVSNGERYFLQSGGTGTELFPGDVITTSQDIFLFGATTNPIVCINETSYRVDIIDTSVFQSLEACGEYTLPNVTFGGYFTQAMGGGDAIPEGTVITESQTIFYYAPEVTTAPNCTDNIQMDITIRPLPPVDSLNDILRCEDDLPVLQPLVHGDYFTESGGQGTQLFAGDQVSASQTIYVYNTNAFCDAETSFQVEIRPLPLVDNFTDIFSCEPYTLPVLSNGRYFTESNGQGTELNAGQVISETQTLYIFNEYADLTGCINENVFTIEILGIEVDEPENVVACETFELLELNVGEYFTESGGQGTQLFPGDLITETQTIYVYAENGDRFVCTDEHEFSVTIFGTPVLPDLPHLEGCESVELPVLDTPGITVEYYRRPNRVDLITPSDYTITALGSRIIYVYAYQTGNPDCFTETFFQVTVFPLLDLDIEGGTICINGETGELVNPFLLQSGLNPNEFEVNWYLNGELVGTGPDYNAVEVGTYVVETIKLTVDVGANCNYNPTEVSVNSSAPQFEVNFLTGVFDDNSTIEIVILDSGLGYYEFSLDDGPFQEFNRFYNVPPGNHTITVRDRSGICGDFVYEFKGLDYPDFFTPNDDGINDTWNIPDLRNDANATIKIFNRLGRLVAEIRPSGVGWNGFNGSGKKEPSSDYWFLVEFTNNGIPTSFKGHFALLRR
jgi:gliding motility-associated-like protein